MAGLAAVTSKIEIYATAATLDAPSGYRRPHGLDNRLYLRRTFFGVNLVTGWQNRNMTRWGSGPAMNTSPAAMTT